jgi:hypothetical protein
MGAQGTALLDFGAFPGASDAKLDITGQAAILSGSLVEAWMLPADTADHKADEHIVEPLKVMAGNVVAGTGFTIYGVNDNQINEPTLAELAGPGGLGIGRAPSGSPNPDMGGKGTRVYGKWNVGWVWN